MRPFYTDKRGAEWSRENIEDLIDAVRAMRRINSIVEHYRFKLTASQSSVIEGNIKQGGKKKCIRK
jgi:hypothetical protein